MIALLSRTFRSAAAPGQPIAGIYAALVLANLTAWAWALLVFRDRPILLGTALLAYGLGLRHAVDADHIAAIDNATRKLMQQGKRPVGVGLFFAMGHSSVVVLAAFGVAGAATALAGSVDRFKTVGSVVGTGVSASFLFAIAIVNLIILRGVWRTFEHVRKGGRYVEEDFDLLLAQQPRSARAPIPPAAPNCQRELAHVPNRLPVRACIRHCDRGGAARPVGDRDRQRRVDLGDDGVSGTVRRGDVADRHHRRHFDARRLRLDVQPAAAQA